MCDDCGRRQVSITQDRAGSRQLKGASSGSAGLKTRLTSKRGAGYQAVTWSGISWQCDKDVSMFNVWEMV